MAKSGRWSEAVDLLEEARQDGLDPNKYCFTAAVSACAKGRNWKLALSLLDQMRDAGLKPDHVTYGSAVSAMAKVGEYERALDLLRQMAVEGLQPNVVCYGAAVDACAKGGQFERAVALLEEMSEAGVEPDRICYNAAVNACAQSGEWGLALSLADKMRQAEKAGRPDVFTFNSIMNGMASVGEWERLLAVLAGMKTDGVAPDVVSYNTAMGACNKACQHKQVLSIFDSIGEAGVTPDKESFSAAAEACASDESGGMGARAIELLEMARAQGIKRPGPRAVAASLAACIGGGSPWRQAIPSAEKLLQASGRSAWDDLMNVVTKVYRDCEKKRERKRKSNDRVSNTTRETGAKDDGVFVVVPDDRREAGREGGRVNGQIVTNKRCIAAEGAPSPPPNGRGKVEIEGSIYVAPGAQLAREISCAPLKVWLGSQVEEDRHVTSDDENCQRRQRHGNPFPKRTGATANPLL